MTNGSKPCIVTNDDTLLCNIATPTDRTTANEIYGRKKAKYHVRKRIQPIYVELRRKPVPIREAF